VVGVISLFAVYNYSTMSSFPVIIVVGPTSSGKSELAVKLARKFGGEIISADSRQVYKGLNIGSGKVPRDKLSKNYNLKAKSYQHQGIPHHLLDVASPRRQFTVAQYQKLAVRALENIVCRGRLPIICGGTGFYVSALCDNLRLPPVPPNSKLRAKLEKLSTAELGKKLEILDPERLKNIDQMNRLRLIRAIEIATVLGQVPPLKSKTKGSLWGSRNDLLNLNYNWLIIGIKLDPKKLREKINTCLISRLRSGLIQEVKKLHENELSWQRLEALGLEYAHVACYLQNQTTKKQMIRELEFAIWHYAKRQMTWWRRDQTIHWLKNYSEAEQLARGFLKNQVRY